MGLSDPLTGLALSKPFNHFGSIDETLTKHRGVDCPGDDRIYAHAATKINRERTGKATYGRLLSRVDHEARLR